MDPYTKEVVAYECYRDVFLLEGENSKQWCNGIFTNNIRSMEPPQYKHNAYCNDRGHVKDLPLYFASIRNLFSAYWNLQRWKIFQRFSMYMILDDIENTTKKHQNHLPTRKKPCFIFGKNFSKSKINFPSPTKYGHNPQKTIFCIPHDRTGFGGIDIITTNEETHEQVLLCLQTHQIAIGTTEGLESLRIASNRVSLHVDAPEKHFVHELRINEDCCAFDKGCYVGQEIINRMDVKGILNKRLTRILLQDEIDLPCEVFLDNNLNKSIGKITSKAQTPLGLLGLAILRKEAWVHQQKLIIKNADKTIEGSVFEPENTKENSV